MEIPTWLVGTLGIVMLAIIGAMLWTRDMLATHKASLGEIQEKLKDNVIAKQGVRLDNIEKALEKETSRNDDQDKAHIATDLLLREILTKVTMLLARNPM
jgi:hypothetical protein